MRAHPYANLFPMLPELEIQALADDIRANGLLDPVITYEDQILDGRNRAAACQRAGIEPLTQPYRGHDPLGFVVSKNLHRRHLSTSQRAIIAAELEHGKHGRPEKDANLQVNRGDAARLLNVSERSVASAAALLEAAPEKAEEIKLGKIDETVSGALKQAKRASREQDLRLRRADAVAEARKSERSCLITQGDIHEWRPDGVDAIVTDPPYITSNAVELYSALADFAVDVLPNGGALATMCWQPILPAVMAAMNRPELVFRWLIAWEFDSGENNARTFDMKRRVHDGWKPVLVYHKNGWADDCESIYDVIRSQGRILDDHVWEQGVEGVEKLVRYVSRAGDTVCDPFCGSGTTGIAALKLDRDFIGADLDPSHVNIARSKLEPQVITQAA